MTLEQRKAWEVFCSELPWLNSTHRSLLQLACMLRARIESDPDIGISTMQVYSAVLSKLGATPADESKISHVDDDEPDPTDRFFN